MAGFLVPKRFGPSEEISRMVLDSPQTICVACVIFVCFCLKI